MRPRTLYQTMALIALAYVLFSSKAHGQYVVYEYPTQCPGGCGPWYCEPQQQYYQGPRQQPRQQGPQPDGQQTPPVGAPGTPQFESLPGPPPVQTPPQAPEPTFDWDAYDKQQKEILEQQKLQNAELHSLLVIIQKQQGCQCKPTDLTEINAKLDSLTVQIQNVQPQQQPAPDPKPAPVGARRLYLRAVPIQ